MKCRVPNIAESRVRTFFLDYFKIQHFFHTFFQNNNFFFPDSRLSKLGDEQRPTCKRTKEQSFFHGLLQTYGQDGMRFDQNKKNSLTGII